MYLICDQSVGDVGSSLGEGRKIRWAVSPAHRKRQGDADKVVVGGWAGEDDGQRKGGFG